MTLEIAHIVVRILPERLSENCLKNSLVFESMLRARVYAHPGINVSFYVSTCAGGSDNLPDGFTKVQTRRCSDGSKSQAVFDVVNRVYMESDAQYFVYTDVTVALMPYFYASVAKLINDGRDALAVKGRGVPAEDYKSVNQLWRLYSAVGKANSGYDCFVFRREMVPLFEFDENADSYCSIQREFLKNLVTYSKSINVLEDVHLVFALASDTDDSEKGALGKNEPSTSVHFIPQVPVKKTVRYEGLDLGSQLDEAYGKHRSGWSWVIQGLAKYCTPNGLYLDTFLERTFAWQQDSACAICRDWVGIVHVPLNGPEWFRPQARFTSYCESPEFKRSLPYCRGLFTLSEYLKRDLEKYVDVPVQALFHPIDEPCVKWSPESFQANEKKSVVQVGWFLRRLNAIYLLPSSQYRKVFLHTGEVYVDRFLGVEREILKQNSVYYDYMNETVDVISYLSCEAYDEFLSSNIVFLHLYDASANNTIVECISRTTPVLVNEIEPVREYLGSDYPLYYKSYDEAIEKAENFALLIETHDYLKKLNQRKNLTRDNFCRQLVESAIMRRLLQ